MSTLAPSPTHTHTHTPTAAAARIEPLRYRRRLPFRKEQQQPRSVFMERGSLDGLNVRGPNA